MLIIKLTILAITGIYIIYKDMKERIIPNLVNLGILISGGLVTLLEYDQWLSHVLGFLVLGILIFLLAVITKGFGMGDVKYIFATGLLIGLLPGLYGLMFGFLLGGLVSAILLLMKKVDKKTMIPFGPFLVIGNILGLLYYYI